MGLVGRKRGMTRVFSEQGMSVPVTVIEVLPNRITQIKSEKSDGYIGIQITTGSRPSSRVTKAVAGHLVKANVESGRGFWEFRLTNDEQDQLVVGGEIRVGFFKLGQLVDVAGVSIGKGFAGTVKRHNFSMQDATHGNSLSHRAPGSIGQRQTPGRVFKGKKMAGHMGNSKCTAQSLEVIRIDDSRNLLLVKGSIPGATGGDVIITPASRASS